MNEFQVMSGPVGIGPSRSAREAYVQMRDLALGGVVNDLHVIHVDSNTHVVPDLLRYIAHLELEVSRLEEALEDTLLEVSSLEASLDECLYE